MVERRMCRNSGVTPRYVVFQLTLPAMTCVRESTCGEHILISGMVWTIVSSSRKTRVLLLPLPVRTPCTLRLPASTQTKLSPRFCNWLRTRCEPPSPMETVAMNAAMPIAMPNIARPVRNLFFAIPSRARRVDVVTSLRSMRCDNTRALRKRPAFITIALILALAIVILALRRRETTKYITTTVTRGSVVASVEATGTINPLTTAPVGSYVSGTVKYIFVDFNSRVHAGQVLAQIDPAVYEARLVEARGNLQRADANLVSAQANVTKADADLAYARANAKRMESLHRQGLTPLDQRQLSESTAAQSAEQRNQAIAQVEQARADINSMRGALQEAETN